MRPAVQLIIFEWPVSYSGGNGLYNPFILAAIVIGVGFEGTGLGSLLLPFGEAAQAGGQYAMATSIINMVTDVGVL